MSVIATVQGYLRQFKFSVTLYPSLPYQQGCRTWFEMVCINPGSQRCALCISHDPDDSVSAVPSPIGDRERQRN